MSFLLLRNQANQPHFLAGPFVIRQTIFIFDDAKAVENLQQLVSIELKGLLPGFFVSAFDNYDATWRQRLPYPVNAALLKRVKNRNQIPLACAEVEFLIGCMHGCNCYLLQLCCTLRLV